ncbi:MAG: metalloregulator ArsR/SmtB family transcription factor [Thermoleophilia bacterium]
MALDDYEAVLKAAGDPARARILKLLEGRELCVSQLMEILDLSQSTVSGHLSVLKKAGLLKRRKSGRLAYSSLADRKHNDYSLPMLALMLGWLDDDPQVRSDRRKLAMILADK